MKPYAELIEFNQPNPIRIPGYTRIRDQFPELYGYLFVDGHSAGGDPPERIAIPDPERIMEFAGRWDYGEKNAGRLGQKTKMLKGGYIPEDAQEVEVGIITKWIASGEQSMIEMGHATVFFECSRVVTHELVRHRLASYQQESQRFTLQVLDEDSFYIPTGLDAYIERSMRNSYYEAAKTYQRLLDAGVPKQIARYVLPNGTRTRIIVSANTREWRHIFKLRLDKSAQPEMREMMQMAFDQMLPVFPQSLEGIAEEGRGIR